jgi:hypothetical protein
VTSSRPLEGDGLPTLAIRPLPEATHDPTYLENRRYPVLVE